jgi:Arc/MetJ-type ribon-helix-helix transcriptional regulator
MDIMKRKTRTDFIRAAVTPEEKKTFEKLAQDRKTTISEVIRQALYRELQPQKEQTA